MCGLRAFVLGGVAAVDSEHVTGLAEYLDEMVRFQEGHLPASLLVSRLQASARQNQLT